MSKNFNNGVWPVMLTPFTDDNRVDYDSLEKLINWYIENGVAGLFADCQSSEMFFLSLEVRPYKTENFYALLSARKEAQPIAKQQKGRKARRQKA